MNTSDVRCVMAQHGISVNHDGSLDPCCQYTRSTSQPVIHFQDWHKFDQVIRREMLDDYDRGQRHAGCQKCYREEDLGLFSLRQYANDWYPDASATEIAHVELRLGNLCNLRCVMCHPQASSSIETERYQHRDRLRDLREINISVERIERSAAWWETAEFRYYLQEILGHVRRLNITGGEPFMIPAVQDILTTLLSKNSHVDVSFNTNLTKLSAEILALLGQFSKITMAVSLEGVGSANDWLRYPSRWSVIEYNLDLLRRHVPSATICVNHTLQHASVHTLPDLAKFCHEESLQLHMTMVQGMPWLTLSSARPDLVQHLAQWAVDTTYIDHPRRNFVINACAQTEFDPVLHANYEKFIQAFDDIRGTQYIQQVGEI